MKLAEAALAESADCQKKIEKLKERLVNCVRVQEGEQPIEDPNALLKDLRATHDRMTDLVTRLNRTNSSTDFTPGTGLSMRWLSATTSQCCAPALLALSKRPAFVPTV